MPLSKQVFGFPKRLQVKLRYAAYEGLFLSSVAGTVNKYFFSCNSIFDPDRTGTGHQPLYRDTYAGIYDHYAVVRSHCTVRYVNQNASNAWNVGLVIEDDTAGSTVVDTIAEQSLSKSTFMTPLSGNNSMHVINKNWDCVSGLSIDPYTSELYKTDFVSNPTEEQFYCIWGNDAGAGTSNLLFQVELVYDCIFTELQTPTQS